MSKKLLLYAFVLLWFTACTFHHTNKLLSLSEQQMSQHPDSALFLLQSMQTSDLRLPEQKAKYALLLSMARDIPLLPLHTIIIKDIATSAIGCCPIITPV